MNTKIRLLLLSLALCNYTNTVDAQQSYPARPIRFIVGFAAGGAGGLLARIAGTAAGEIMGQPMVIEYRPGASSIVAIDACAKAAPDGYTVCFVNSIFSFIPFLYSKLPFDPQKDFTGVSHIAYMQEVLMVAPSVPVKSLQELVAYSKANPGKLNYASLGIGSNQHLTIEWIKNQTGADITHVPFNGSAEITRSFMSGEIQLIYQALPSWKKFIVAGKAKPLLVPGNARLSLLPDVPAVAELGLPDFSTGTWEGVIAPAGTPKPVLTRLSAAFAEGLRPPAMREKLAAMGFDPVGNTPEEFNKFLAADRIRGERLVKISGARLD